MNDHVALREFIERVLEERDKALSLQAREYERRLDELNHAHELAREALHTYVPKTLYERDQIVFLEFRDRVNNSLAIRNGATASRNAIVGYIVSAAVVGAAIATILARIVP